MICNICLEELHDNNKTPFCCNWFHSKCIIDCLHICGICPLCRKNYLYFQNKLKKDNNYTNLDQIRNEIIEENNLAISSLISSLECMNLDFGIRINALEEIKSITANRLLNKITRKNDTRISYIENSMNDIENELKKIKRQIREN